MGKSKGKRQYPTPCSPKLSFFRSNPSVSVNVKSARKQLPKKQRRCTAMFNVRFFGAKKFNVSADGGEIDQGRKGRN